MTAGHYVENKQRSVLGFAHLLKSERIIIPIDKNSSRAKSLPKNLIAGVRQNQAARKMNSEVFPTTGADSPAADGSMFLITDSRSTELELPTQSAVHVSSSFYA